MYRHADMDIFLATSRHGQGLGAEALRLLAHHLFEERGRHRLTIDPAAYNTTTIRAYEKAGFPKMSSKTSTLHWRVLTRQIISLSQMRSLRGGQAGPEADLWIGEALLGN